MNTIFNINYKRLIALLLPVALRKPVLFAFLESLTKPVEQLYNRFITQRQQNLYNASITPQVCSLRKLLNDTFDPTARRIYIADGMVNDWTIIYSYHLFNPTDARQPLWVGPGLYHRLSRQGVVTSIGFDFAVYVPQELRSTTSVNRMVSLLNTYKLASKRYVINYY